MSRTRTRTTAAGEQARADALAAFLKSHTGEAMLMSDAGIDVEVIPSNILSLDVALGVGGIPRGRVVEIYGPEHSGKTSVCLAIAGAVHAAGGFVGFVDAEHALDPAWAATFGVRESGIVINQPNSGEKGLDMTIDMAKSGAFDLIIVDSVAALVPQAELDGEMGDQQVGVHARMMSKGMRKLTAVASESGTTVIFINQLREKVGVMYGSPEVTTGGKALKFYASVRLDVRSPAGNRLRVGAKDAPYGQRIKIKVVKNKVAAPFRECEFDLLYGKGIDEAGCVLDAAEEAGVITRPKGSSTYTIATTGEVIPVKGKDNVKQYITEHPEMAAELTEAVYAKLRAEAGPAASDECFDEGAEEFDSEVA